MLDRFEVHVFMHYPSSEERERCSGLFPLSNPSSSELTRIRNWLRIIDAELESLRDEIMWIKRELETLRRVDDG